MSEERITTLEIEFLYIGNSKPSMNKLAAL